ncbi:MAG: DNA repair protein RecO, partial [Alistipes sp.]|nr:DNA repair protein RecO [Alistipes sp.]
MRSYKARGIVLHTIKYGDSSLVAYLLTDTLGRQSYMVQGVRSGRGHGNKGALLQPMFALELEGIVPPRGEMHRIREMRAVVPLRSTPFDVRKSTIALFMAEMLYRLVREVEPSSPLFDFVWGAVGALDEMGSGADFGIGAAAGSGSGGGAGAADSLASGVGSGSGSGSG